MRLHEPVLLTPDLCNYTMTMQRIIGVPAWLVLIQSLVVVFGCTTIQVKPRPHADGDYQPAAADGLASGVYLNPTAPHASRWVLLLPGASGLTVFGDTQHYFRAADAIASKGFNVLVVDYKLAYRNSPVRPDGATGSKIAWVVKETVQWAKQRGVIREGERGAIVAWSLGAEGLWHLFSDSNAIESVGISAAASYYPANESALAINPPVPLALFLGEKDDVTPALQARNSIPHSNSELVKCHIYPDAHHGFDIESVQPVKRVSLVPIIGPAATFGYDKPSADDARKKLLHFLDSRVPSRR